MRSTIVTVTALGSVAAMGAAAGAIVSGGAAVGASDTSTTPVPVPVEIRTVIVHRTERVVRHVHRHRHRPAALPGPAAMPVAQPVARAVAPVPARATPPRLVTRTSGAATRREHDDAGERGGRDD